MSLVQGQTHSRAPQRRVRSAARTSMRTHTVSTVARSNFSVNSFTAASPRSRTLCTMGSTCERKHVGLLDKCAASDMTCGEACNDTADTHLHASRGKCRLRELRQRLDATH